ncbi:hypothetical protein [Streptomyces longwoodensis]|uniref:hypothetical protein n=1 Tax=Streptomyces longwoodensis TaxID=68231 RepID=UPI0038503CAC
MVLPDRSVLHTSRDGIVPLTDATGNTSVAGSSVSTVTTRMEGVTADPGFAANRFVYLYYAPPLSTPGGGCPLRRLGLRLHPVRRGQPAFAVRAEDRRHPGPDEREEGPRRSGVPRYLLQRGRGHGLRRGRQPLSFDGRRQQPVRLGRPHADLRAPQPRLRRAAFRGQRQRPARKGCGGPAAAECARPYWRRPCRGDRLIPPTVLREVPDQFEPGPAPDEAVPASMLSSIS